MGCTGGAIEPGVQMGSSRAIEPVLRMGSSLVIEPGVFSASPPVLSLLAWALPGVVFATQHWKWARSTMCVVLGLCQECGGCPPIAPTPRQGGVAPQDGRRAACAAAPQQGVRSRPWPRFLPVVGAPGSLPVWCCDHDAENSVGGTANRQIFVLAYLSPGRRVLLHGDCHILALL